MPESKWYLRKGIGSWSAGTQVEFVNPTERGLLDHIPDNVVVRVLAGDQPIIDVPEDYLVERKKGVRTDSDS